MTEKTPDLRPAVVQVLIDGSTFKAQVTTNEAIGGIHIEEELKQKFISLTTRLVHKST